MRQYWRVFALTLAIMAVGAYQLYGVFSNAGYSPEQPIHYSHALHAGVLKMECLYCHSNAEKGPVAGVPTTDICMGCHGIVKTGSPEIQRLTAYHNAGKPVPWVRIHQLPDHAYFTHKPHIAAGVACQTCHGPIQEEPVVRQFTKLEMGKCMECHRSSDYVRLINHPPTYHEQPAGAGEDEGESKDKHPDPENPAATASETLEMQKSHGDLSPGDSKALLDRLIEYRQDIYLHGRGAQARGQNASVECSTCHQ
ncbi:hypothetical protein BH09SUM1_BH09SUM1_01400 [soil metagenome]